MSVQIQTIMSRFLDRCGFHSNGYRLAAFGARVRRRAKIVATLDAAARFAPRAIATPDDEPIHWQDRRDDRNHPTLNSGVAGPETLRGANQSLDPGRWVPLGG